jgi:hypothetical protein
MSDKIYQCRTIDDDLHHQISSLSQFPDVCDLFVPRDRDHLSYLTYPKAESAPRVDSAEPSHSYPPTTYYMPY